MLGSAVSKGTCDGEAGITGRHMKPKRNNNCRAKYCFIYILSFCGPEWSNG